MDTGIHAERKRQLILRAKARSVNSSWANPLAVLFVVAAGLGALASKVGVQDQIFTIVSLSCGWLMAYYSANWNSQKNTITQLRQTGCKEVVKRAATTERTLSNLHSNLNGLASSIALSMDPVTSPYLPLHVNPAKLLEDWKMYTDSFLELLYSYSENEILLMPLEPFRVAIFEVNIKLGEEHSTFTSLLMKSASTLQRDPNSKTAKEELAAGIPIFTEKLMDQATYLHDFRIELLNFGLGEALGYKIPRRRTADPRFKTLDAKEYR